MSKGGKVVYVKVLKGDVYERQDVTGWADPYVVVKLGDEQRKTTIKKDIKEPVWNEEFKIDKPRNTETNVICFELYDWNRLRTDDFVGRNTISVLPYRNNKQTVTIPMLNTEKEVTEQGNIVVEIELEDSRKAKVIINILQGDIYEQHDTLGWADPYIVIKVGSDERKTTTKKNIKLPVWNEEFKFVDVDLKETNFVIFDLWDWERLGNNDFVASTTLSLIPYRNNKQRVPIVFHNDEKEKKEQASVDVEIEVLVEVHEDDVEAEGVAERALDKVKEDEDAAAAVTAAEEAERQRLAAEEAEKQKLAAEAAAAAEEEEKQRLAAEEAERQRLAEEEAEKQRLAAEEAERQRLAAEEAERQRVAEEEAERQRLAAEEAEKQRLAEEEAEKQRLAAEEAEKQRLAEEEAEKQRLAAEEAEKQRLVAKEVERQKLAAEAAAAAEEAEKQRLAAGEVKKKRKAEEEAERKRKVVDEGKVKEKNLSCSSENNHLCWVVALIVAVLSPAYLVVNSLFS